MAFRVRTVALAAMVGTWGVSLAACSTSPGPSSAVQTYLSAWGHQDYRAMERLVSRPPKDFVSFNQRTAASLDIVRASYRVESQTQRGSSATVQVESSYVLTALGPWSVRSELQLSDSSGHWLVEWSPRSIVPSLGPGDSLSETVSWPTRAAILGANGAPLTTDATMVSVGVEGSRVTDPNSLTSALVQSGATAAEVSSALTTAKAHPDWFVPVVTLTEARYMQLKPIIYPVPGTVFQNLSQRTAVTPGLAAHVVGALGPITAQELHALGPPYRSTDSVGQLGIEQSYERQLAGRPGGNISILDGSGNTVTTVATFNPTAGSPVQTTIDPGVQQAAEAALIGVTDPASLVAVQASTGSVLAAVSVPTTDQFDNALAGSYPPGSTFKVVTSADLIEHGSTPSSTASCPPTINVGGETFHNFEGETQASLSLEQAFAESCNAAFIGLAGSLPYKSFSSTASQFGIGSAVHMGLSAFGGKVPDPTSDSQRAATSIGQDGVLVSPLSMAVAAASVDSGNLHLPRLVQGAADDSAPSSPIDPTVVSDLQTMMAAVVDSPNGTAAGAGLPSGTHGKTGTAEFGSANPPQTHAWFIGYRGDLAFAVLVVGGGIGGAVAAPIAAKFLSAVPNVS